MNSFPPVIDNGTSPKPFLLKHPNDLLLEEPQKIPLMTGINYDEGLIKTAGKKWIDLFVLNITHLPRHFSHFSAAMFNNPSLFVDLAVNFDRAAPIIFYYDHLIESVRDDVTEKIKKFYFGDGVTKTNVFNVTNVMSLWFELRTPYKLVDRL